MQTLNDYVNWVATTMGIKLTDKQNKIITNQLIRSDKYQAALKELENMIEIANK